ncbi:MAG: guanitoxin biosynthesis pre-guanitoxin forming N-methyltransferase GntF [Cyanobacteria bacterium P01_H01_bin.21]
MQTLEVKYANYSDWDPQKYLQEYYSGIMPDEQYCLEFLIESLKRSDPVSVALDFGSGPIISHILPLVTKAKEIHVSEYVESNLVELRKWFSADGSAYDWRPFTQEILRLETHQTPGASDVGRRETETREKVTYVTPGDVRDPNPLGEAKRNFYPLVTAHYCAEGISLNKDEWRTYMRNIMSMVKPGGRLITSACGSGSYYRVGESCFPSTELNPQDILSCFLDNGFVNLDIRVRDLPEYSEQGFFYTIFACGVKSPDT